MPTIYQVTQSRKQYAIERRAWVKARNKQADKLLASLGLRMVVSRSDDRPPAWEDGKDHNKAHGIHYYVTIEKWIDNNRLAPVAFLAFDFWGSIADREASEAHPAGPIPADRAGMLDCLRSDASMPDTAGEVYQEFGEMRPSQAEAIAAHGRKVRAFFTADELEKLREFAEA
jgi:hypothetical protein